MGIGLYVFFLFIKKNISLRCSKTNDKNTFARDWKAEINSDFDCGSFKPLGWATIRKENLSPISHFTHSFEKIYEKVSPEISVAKLLIAVTAGTVIEMGYAWNGLMSTRWPWTISSLYRIKNHVV